MSDYISREALKEAFENADADVCESYYPDGYCDWGFGRKNINDVIDGVPAADVEPVRHVVPVRCGMDEYYGEWVRCPNCDFDLNTSAAKFCGGCGAKMDLEGEKQ